VLEARFAKSFGSFSLDVEFGSESGRTTVILGESGSGKSMVLKMLSGLLAPDDGFFALDGRTYVDTARKVRVPPQERPVGYIFQDYVLFPHLSVVDNVGFGLRMQRVPKAEIRERVAEALAQVHLVGYDDRRPAQLSGGQQQRVAIARALALRPALLLLDESLSALDIQTRHEVQQELREVLSGLDLTAVMVTHQYRDALMFADQIMVLDGGLVTQRGTHPDLLRDPSSAYVAEMVGVNYVRAEVVAVDPGPPPRVSAALGAGDRRPVTVQATWDAPGGTRPERGREVALVIHPRNIALHASEPDAGAENVLRAEVVEALPVSATVGEDGGALEGVMQVSLRVDPSVRALRADVTVTAARPLDLSPGAVVHASFAADDARVLA